MKVCLICDLHLPAEVQAIQYDVLSWIGREIDREQPDLILTVGDFTADGDLPAAGCYCETIRRIGIPHVLIAGNSDVRTPETVPQIRALESPAVTSFGAYTVLALHDCFGSVPEAELPLLDRADDHTLVIMHHPPKSGKWKQEHPDVPLFYGHLHIRQDDGNVHCLQAADPDKAIGEEPCISWYDTETKALTSSHYSCPLPHDLADYLGISCFYPLRDLPYAAEHHLRCIELRPNTVNTDRRELKVLVDAWRKAGGVNLSLHAPNVELPENRADWEKWIAMAQELEADRVTIHVPHISVQQADEETLQRCAAFTAACIDRLPEHCTAGIENMHMTPGDTLENRGYGFAPEEVVSYMHRVRALAHRPVGFNLDTGHARNNAPFSQHAPLGTWYALTGPEAVGYHIHQVTMKNGVMQNHKPITSLYGSLISYASFFRLWSEHRINHVPVILELRPSSPEDIPYLESVPLLMGGHLI